MPYAFTVMMNRQPVPLFGDIVFARHDDEGDTIGLNDEDIRTINAKLPA